MKNVVEFVELHPRISGFMLGLALSLAAITQYDHAMAMSAKGENGPAIVDGIMAVIGFGAILKSLNG